MFSVQQKARWPVSSSQDTSQPRVVADPGMCRSLLPGNRRSPSLSPPVVAGTASGRPEAVADDEREGEVGPARSSREASEQSGLGCGEARGAKGRDQGESGSAKHGPDAEPGSRVTGAGPHTRSRHQEQTGQSDSALTSPCRRCSASDVGLKKSAAPGVDEVTWTEYAEDLEVNLSDLHSRVQAGAYRALPSRRTYIRRPMADSG